VSNAYILIWHPHRQGDFSCNVMEWKKFEGSIYMKRIEVVQDRVR